MSDSLEKEIMTEEEQKKKKKKIAALIIGGVLLLCAVAGFFIYNNVISAVTMRIQRLVGTVNLYNEEGNEQALREKMRLGAGQTVTTSGESLIMVSLDDTKLMTMEETSKAEIKARGKKLLFDLIEGNLFFNVTEKLSENESFDITTQTMICGIRGTSAYVGRDSTSHEVLMVTDGLVHVVATNPITKETTEIDVPAGQMITIYLDEEAEGDKTISIKMQAFKEEDLPAMALDTIRKNKALMARVAKATGFSSKKLTTLADLSSVKGVSMYGSAADDLRSEGVDDAIPFMGYRSQEMTTSANSAVNIAKDDLPLEVAIIQGYRDVMDVGTQAGYDKDNLSTLMEGSRSCMEDTFILVDSAGLRSIDRINVATRISDTLKVSAGRMTTAKLSTSEIGQVLEAEKKLFTDAVKDSAGATSDGSKGADVLASLDKIGDHVTGTVDDEMNKSSNGDQTVIALLGRVSDERSSVAEAAKEETDSIKKNDEIKTAAGNVEDGRGNEGGNGTGGSTNAAANTGSNTGAATPQEIKAAKAAIAFTDPGSGVVALSDGTLFDPKYYAGANPDVVSQYGTSTEALLAEWLKEGKAQGRPPIAPVQTVAKTNTEEKPDWLVKQEQKEREQARASRNEDEDNNDSGDDSSSNSGSGSGGGQGGQNGNTPQPKSTAVAGNLPNTFIVSGTNTVGPVILSDSNGLFDVSFDHTVPLTPSMVSGGFELPIEINGTVYNSFSNFRSSMGKDTLSITKDVGSATVTYHDGGTAAMPQQRYYTSSQTGLTRYDNATENADGSITLSKFGGTNSVTIGP